MVCMIEKPPVGTWEKVSIELPPGWREALSNRARDINRGQTGKGKYLWAVAADLLLGLKPDVVRRHARELQNMNEDDFVALVARHCDDPDIVGELAARSIQKPGEPLKRRRGAKSG